MLPDAHSFQKVGCFLERDVAEPAAGPGRRGREGTPGASHTHLFLKGIRGGGSQAAGGVPLRRGPGWPGLPFSFGGTWVWPFVGAASVFTEER